MSYQLLPFRQSPNYTPGSQTAAFYGRPRTIEFGAGHWWNLPELNPTFDGVVSMMLNAARQAAAHDVVGDSKVQPMVRAQDTAWCTGSANPYTYAMEVDPHIMYRWQAGGDKAKANRIFETLAERIADLGYHNLTWRPHNSFPGSSTQCNPIRWGEVMERAKQIWQAKYGTPPAPAVKEQSRVVFNPPKVYVFNKDARLYDVLAYRVVSDKIYKAGEEIEFAHQLTLTNGNKWFRTVYSDVHNIANGFRAEDVYEKPAPVQIPEWQRNMKPITAVKLMVLPGQTPIVDLRDGSVIKQLGQGTWIDFTHITTVGGIEFLISNYSATNGMPNGIKRSDVGVPATPPVNEKPAWLEKWEDIADVKMYTRVDAQLVDLLNGKTIKIIPRGTEIAVASTTEMLHKKYAITEYSTAKKLGQGILIDDLDMKPIDPKPVDPAPQQPSIEDRLTYLERAIDAILKFLKLKV